MKMFSDTLPFYKANFHCHTDRSDGRLTPEECAAFYHDAEGRKAWSSPLRLAEGR